MGRIRTIKPEFFKHEALYDLEHSSGLPIRISFVGLLTCCDREGRFKWRPRALKPDILPYDDLIDFEAVLDAMVAAGLLLKYEAEGDVYGCIPTFLKHQSINQREAQSSIPAPPACAITKAHVHAHASTPYEYKGVNIAPALRETIFARDGHKCLRCGSLDDLTVDHIFPQSIGGGHAPSNLRTLCRSCNSARPVVGQALLDDLARDGLTLGDMQRMCTHVQAHGEGKGREGKGREGEKEGKEQTLVERRGASPDVDVVKTIFEYWQKTMQSPKSQLDDKRKKAIKAALKLYDPRQLCEAVLGCSKSDFHMARGEYHGRNKHNGLLLILRDAEHIDKFIELASKRANGPESIEDRNARILAELMEGDAAIDPDVIDIDMEELDHA